MVVLDDNKTFFQSKLFNDSNNSTASISCLGSSTAGTSGRRHREATWGESAAGPPPSHSSSGRRAEPSPGRLYALDRPRHGDSPAPRKLTAAPRLGSRKSSAVPVNPAAFSLTQRSSPETAPANLALSHFASAPSSAAVRLHGRQPADGGTGAARLPSARLRSCGPGASFPAATATHLTPLQEETHTLGVAVREAAAASTDVQQIRSREGGPAAARKGKKRPVLKALRRAAAPGEGRAAGQGGIPARVRYSPVQWTCGEVSAVTYHPQRAAGQRRAAHGSAAR